jgi:pyrroloquinoline quinone biosynthesis protein E
VITPTGLALPCHAADSIPGVAFDSVRDRSLVDIWEQSPGFAAFRGDEWMRDPCRSCPVKQETFGGCRCQAFALTGDARNADPVCSLSPYHAIVDEALAATARELGEDTDAYRYRMMPAARAERAGHGADV